MTDNLDTLPDNHWAHDPEFVELLPVLHAGMTREEAQKFKDVVDGESEALAAFIQAPENFPARLAMASNEELYHAYAFTTSAKAAAESSTHVIPRHLVPWFERALTDIRAEVAHRGVNLVLPDAPLDNFAVGMILKLGFSPEKRQRAFEEAAKRQGGYS